VRDEAGTRTTSTQPTVRLLYVRRPQRAGTVAALRHHPAALLHQLPDEGLCEAGEHDERGILGCSADHCHSQLADHAARQHGAAEALVAVQLGGREVGQDVPVQNGLSAGA